MKTHKEALREAHKLWKTQKNHNLLSQEKHLNRKKPPDTNEPLNQLQTWIRSIRNAIQAAESYRKKHPQPTLDKWIMNPD